MAVMAASWKKLVALAGGISMTEPAKEDHVELIEDCGLQATRQRVAVYQAIVASNGEHPSTNTIYKRIREEFPTASQANVYKTLELFHLGGLIQKICVNGVARYDEVFWNHHHLVCMKCQAIRNVNGHADVQRTCFPNAEAFVIVDPQVFLYGYCEDCYRN